MADPQPPPHESPRPFAWEAATPPGEASRVWADDRRRTFAWRAKCLGTDRNPEVQALLAAMAAEEAALAELRRREEAGDLAWWADGEYDRGRADAANDAGVAAFRGKAWDRAHTKFAEAVRLNPQAAAYHVNKAKAALRLGQPAVAAADLEHALCRCDAARRADLLPRLARAHEAAGAWPAAEAAWAEVDDEQASSAGRARCRAAVERAAGARAAERAAHAAGRRPGLPRAEDPGAEAAAELLATARAMRGAHGGRAWAPFAEAEALILCQRWADALRLVAELPPGVDAAYLRAEALWRSGDLAGARAALAPPDVDVAAAPKLASLEAHLRRLDGLERELDAALEAERFAAADAAATALVAAAQPARLCSGLHARWAVRRAGALRRTRGAEAALAALGAALRLEPEHAAAHVASAQLLRALGRHEAAFLALERARQLRPDDLGLAELVQEAARLALRGDGEAGGEDVLAGAPAGALETLGLRPGATQADAKRAYRRLAAKWHPDKWAARPAEAQTKAAAMFRAIKGAYDEVST